MSAPPQPGDQIADRYRLGRRLGAGAMGVVHEAFHETLRRRYAIKILDTGVMDPEMVPRFVREARTVSALGHPSIVRVFDAGFVEGSGLPYLVMERLEGTTLAHVVKEQAPLSAPRVVELLEGPAMALDHVHARGILHRDLKPENLFLHQTPGGQIEVKIVDFGLAIEWGEGAAPRLTPQGVRLGTPAYMAPETLTEGPEPDLRADVYSLAVIAFELLAGRLQFESSRFAHKLTETAPRLADVRGAPTSEAIEAVFRSTLARDRAARPPSASAFFRALRRAAGLAPPVPAPDPRGVGARKRAVIVDDDADLARQVIEALARHGVDARHAGTVAEGIAELEAPCDLAIVDGLLPDGSGLEVCATLRGREARPRVVFVSAFFRDAPSHALLGQLGVDERLRKPIEPALLTRRALDLLGVAAEQPSAIDETTVTLDELERLLPGVPEGRDLDLTREVVDELEREVAAFDLPDAARRVRAAGELLRAAEAGATPSLRGMEELADLPRIVRRELAAARRAETQPVRTARPPAIVSMRLVGARSEAGERVVERAARCGLWLDEDVRHEVGALVLAGDEGDAIRAVSELRREAYPRAIVVAGVAAESSALRRAGASMVLTGPAHPSRLRDAALRLRAAIPTRPARILAVDDDEPRLARIELWLGERGHEVATSVRRAALEAAMDEIDPDVLLLGADDPEELAAIRASEVHGARALVALTSDERAAPALRAVADDALLTPLDEARLIACVDGRLAALARRRHLGTDPRSGLLARAAFLERARCAVARARARREELAVVAVEVRDTGRRADERIRVVAQRFARVGDLELAGRWRDTRAILVLPARVEDEVETIAETIRDRLGDARVATALSPQHGVTLEALLERALGHLG